MSYKLIAKNYWTVHITFYAQATSISEVGEFFIQMLTESGMNDHGLFAKTAHFLSALGIVAKKTPRPLTCLKFDESRVANFL